MLFEPFVRAFLVRARESRIAGDIAGKDRCETTLDGLLHCPPSARRIIAVHSPSVVREGAVSGRRVSSSLSVNSSSSSSMMRISLARLG
jgi:hypothetical protein